MFKKLILVFVGVVFFFSYHLVFASLVINEIMYNPKGVDTNSEWVEFFNNGNESVTIISGKSDSAWRFDDGASSLHYINDGLVIPADSYAILASDKTTFLSEYPEFSGLVADTTMSLDNTGTIKLWDGSNPRILIASQSYIADPNANDTGNSLQLVNGSWVGATPTPGMVNQSLLISSTTSNTTTSDTSSVVVGGGLSANYSNNNISPSSNTSITNNQTSTIKTQILGKTFGFVGLPISLNATTFGPSGEKLYFGKYFWNFGDGDSKEINLTDSQPFTHLFYYPGNYVVSLNYYQNYYGSTIVPDVTSQINIKIIGADISISNVGDDKDFFVELTNNTDYNADISGWVLSSAQKSFSFPQNTIIISKQKMMISPKITDFSINDKNTLKLMDSEGNTIFDYADPTVPVVVTTPGKPTDSQSVDIFKPKTTATTLVAEDIPDVNNLIATALPNNIQEPNDSNGPATFSSPKEIMIFIAAFIFVGLSAYLIYFVRQKKILPKENGSDFEILDE